MSEFPSPSMAQHGTLLRHGIKLGELFSYHGVHPLYPDLSRLVRAQASPDKQRAYDLVEEGSGVVVASHAWRQRMWAVGFLAPGEVDHPTCPGWRAPMPVDEVVRLAIIEHRETGQWR